MDRICPKQKDICKDANVLCSRLATTIRDFDPRLQFATRVHETPFVFPLLITFVEFHFPGLVEGFEPVTPVSTNDSKD